MRDPDRSRRDGLRSRLDALGIRKTGEPKPDLSVLTEAELRAFQAIGEALETRTERPAESKPVELFEADGRGWIGRAYRLPDGMTAVVEITGRGPTAEDPPEDGA